MNLLKRIKIENVKGKDVFEVSFTDLYANQPSIIVAPNGYGKSTIATAFKAASSGRMKLDPKDIFQQNENNHPKLEIELCGENSGVYVSTDTEGEISRNVYIYTINSPLYAKSTTRGLGRNVTPTADLRIEQVIVYDNIPPRCNLDYSYRSIAGEFGKYSKLFVNISDMLTSSTNIGMLLEIKDVLKRCCTQVGIKSKFERFIEGCESTGTATNIKSNIQQAAIDDLRVNNNINKLLNCVEMMRNKPQEWCSADVIFSAIQICKVMEQYYENGENDILKKVYAFWSYKEIKDVIDERLDLFNTTGRNIRTREDHGKLVINFERASSMSNGERDILSFISHLAKFEKGFKKEVGILLIDEVFDYLDGSNILAVQYYLSEVINRCKKAGKILFPIIFTHLDPEVFSNYYFSKKRVHYISSVGFIDLDSSIVKMLRLREKGVLTDGEKEEIEKYYIHYINQNHSLSGNVATQIAPNFCVSNSAFRELLYDEIRDKYLLEEAYNPVMVIAGVRIKIEELVFNQLNVADQSGFISQHKVKNKLQYAESKGVEVPELFYLLQPLYNDGLHLGGKDEDVKRKIKSCYLKTDNLHVRRMIQMMFS